MEIEYPKKLNYEDYEHAFNSYWLNKFVEGQLRDFDTETMRGLVYGYTFTEDYAKGIIPDELSIEYWNQKEDYLEQQLLILDALMSTGDGTRENPFYVICVGQEYELLRSYRPAMRVVSQHLLPGHIDCLELEGLGGYTETIYFDISRWFERGKINDKEAKL